jgi:hypothetical protein
MSPDSKQLGLIYDPIQLKKGQMVLYEGEQAEVISVETMLVIRVQDRIVCGALHARVTPIGESPYCDTGFIDIALEEQE